ncbi:hypothetical protein FT641_18795 [Bacillus paranthracis]|uniref:hypothetical protein n=1 Tax=Bacillus paranthracis TaxID=2026186 RepID=UPI0018799EB4|nr:hypothetical protein [Bacillus paranthracis]MBE7114387.1 hypothetical protein [Bacillus paranthracis]MBE7154740.1 hypothetical protein [Bacillus paranthracis]
MFQNVDLMTLVPDTIMLLICIGLMKGIEWKASEKGKYSFFKFDHKRLNGTGLMMPYMVLILMSICEAGRCVAKMLGVL